MHILQSKFGVSEADVIAGVSSFVIPGIVAFFAIAGAYNVGKRYSAPTNAIQSPAASTRTAAEISAVRPFLVQAAVILALVSGGVGYYLHAYVYSGEVDPLAIKKHFVDFHNYTEISSRTYRHETVKLDGLHCHECTFDDAVTLWNGTAPFVLENSIFVRDDQGRINFNVRTENPIITLTVGLLHDVGALNPSVQFRGGHGPP